MDPTPDDSPSAPMDRVARMTLALAGFMLLLLIAVPFTVDSGPTGYIAPYLIYSLFLTSVGIIIGISLTWLNDPRRQAGPEAIAPEPKLPVESQMLSDDQLRFVEMLAASSGSMWQAELVRMSGFTDSKASRLLSRMEREGLIRRVRDGMGKRVELMESGG
ncbi:MAG: MarR family transcriptional regulator [Candidatus Thalassarchaeaceae archaeon]|nr:MarR family transcriptional regulator [Candidatus Thalassarchaeaceae archaeon]MDP7003875.1 MarR family transcriptional regulator [Candidatus Thalassarchaeaceae archaeon]